MEYRITEREYAALQFMATSMIQIRSLLGNPDKSLSAETLRAIHDLADAWHNVPRAVADGSGSELDFLIELGIKQAVVVYLREGWPLPDFDRRPLNH